MSNRINVARSCGKKFFACLLALVLVVGLNLFVECALVQAEGPSAAPSLEAGLTDEGYITLEGGGVIHEPGDYQLVSGTAGTISIDGGLEGVVIHGQGEDEQFQGVSFTVGSETQLTIQDFYDAQLPTCEQATIEFEGNGVLNVEGTNLIDNNNSGIEQAVIHVRPGTTVEFGGGGTLYGYYSAPCSYIGGAKDEANGTIIFNSGRWFLKGTKGGVLMGGCSTTDKGDDILVNGGQIYAKGVAKGALIGGTIEGKSGNVYINGGLLELFEDFSGPAIGAGDDDNAGYVYVNGGSIKTVLSANSHNTKGEAAVFKGLPSATWEAVQAQNADDYAMLTFDASGIEDDTIEVYVDDSDEPFYVGGKYDYVTNEVKNPGMGGGTPLVGTYSTMQNWLANDASYRLTIDDYPLDAAGVRSAYPNKDGSVFAPESNLYFALSKESHTLKVNGTSYLATWDPDGGPKGDGGFTCEEVVDPGLSFESEATTCPIGKTAIENKLTCPKGLVPTYTSGDTSVATVDAATGVVTGVSRGTTTITATTPQKGTYLAGKATYEVKVLSDPGLSFAQPALTFPEKTTAPANDLTHVAGTVATYSSSDESVAVVDADTGAVTGVAGGVATITATTTATEEYAASSASYTAYVQGDPGIAFKADTKSCLYGRAAPTNELVCPAGLAPTYTSSDPSIATVDAATGEARGVSVGVVTITATTQATSRYLAGSATYTLQVTDNNISTKGTIAPLPDCDFTGSALTPRIAITYEGVALVENTDFTVTYSDNVNVGIATAVIEGIGSYGGEVSVTFTIRAVDISGASVQAIGSCVYDGTAQTPEPVVSFGQYTAVKGRDYQVTYADNKDATANAAVSISALVGGNFTEGTTKDVMFTIEQAEMADATVAIDFPASGFPYTGSAIEPKPSSVTIGDDTLVEGADYTLTYANNVNMCHPYDAEVAKVIVHAAGKNFKEGSTQEVRFAIDATSLENVTVSPIADQVYCRGQGRTPEVKATIGNVTLTQGVDFDVSYSNNTEVGTATIDMVAKTENANFRTNSHKYITFQVVPATLDGFSAAPIQSQEYSGVAIQPKVEVKSADGAVTLVEDADFTVSFADNVNAGSARVTIAGMGNYRSDSTLSATFTIKPTSIQNVSVAAITSQAYTGSQLRPKVNATLNGVMLKEGADYALSYGANVAAGKGAGSVTLVAAGSNFTAGTTQRVGFDISQASISGATVAAIANQTYKGSSITPAISVKVGTKTLTKGTDYTLSYANNVNVGIARVTITGKNNYAGTKTATFKIVAAKSTATFTKTSVSLAYGKTYTAKPKVSGTKGAITYKSSNTKVATVNAKTGAVKVVGIGKATITATAAASGNYAATSASYKVAGTKAAQTAKATAKAKTVKYANVKKKAQVVAPITTSLVKEKAKVTYKKLSGKAALTVNAKTGKVSVKKGTKRGTYTAKVRVTFAATTHYKAAIRTVTVKVVVK